jgi:hypothetical protein
MNTKMKRVRMPNEEERRKRNNEQHRKKNARRKAAATDRGPDTTRLSRLSGEQLQELYNNVGCLSTLTHRLPAHHSRFWCYEADERGYTKKGYPTPVKVTQSFNGPYDNRDISPNTGFMCGSVMLASEGIFASSPSDTCSHLCGNKRCVRVEHLTFEGANVNTKRNYCAGWVFCDKCPDHLVCGCSCSPKCMKIVKNYL